MRRVVIYGAGEAGRMVLSEIRKQKGREFKVLGFFDDNLAMKGKIIDGLKVFGGRNEIKSIVRKYQVDEIIISMPSVAKENIKKIVAHCKAEKVSLLIVPSTMEIIRGNVRLDQIKRLDLADLLDREEITLDKQQIKNFIKGKKILVTGAAGSIGSHIVKKLINFNPDKIIALDINESGIFYLLQDLQEYEENIDRIIPMISDIKSIDFIEQIFKKYKPDIVFHAAAYKHVPLMETHPKIAYINNVMGTLNVLQVSYDMEVDRFIGVSTDKAVYPLSIMGKTKRITELLIKSFSAIGLRGCSVRFGNVLGSNGSVVNVFKKQIKKGGPITITSPNMERFFMTVDEAVSLLLEAGSIGDDGNVYVLDMGRPVKIKDLAETLIALSGFIPDVDIKIEYTGIRLGERIREKLFHDENHVEITEYNGIYVEKNLNIGLSFIEDVRKLYEDLNLLSESELIVAMDELISYYSNIPVQKEIPV